MSTIASLLTPARPAAIASIGLLGPQAQTLVAALFQPATPQTALAPGRVRFGHWPLSLLGSQEVAAREEVVICALSPERIEVHTHGGRLVAEAVLRTLAEAGATIVGWEEFLRAEQPNPLAFETYMALAAAPTLRTAAILLDQQGALRKAIHSIKSQIAAARDDARGALDRLLERAALGEHLTRPWRVMLAGGPNVGKSTLLNALAGYERAIVFDRPGTTRDLVAVDLAWDGWPLEMVDSPGLHQATDPSEVAGIARAREELKRADLIVWVDDATRPQLPADKQEFAAAGRSLRVWNKCDLVEATPVHASLRVSALTGTGVADLGQAIVGRLVGDPPPARGEAVPFTPRQVTLLRDAAEALERGDDSRAIDALAEI